MNSLQTTYAAQIAVAKEDAATNETTQTTAVAKTRREIPRTSDYMALGYTIIWLAIFLFVALTLRRIGLLCRRLDNLDAQIKQIEDTPD